MRFGHETHIRDKSRRTICTFLCLLGMNNFSITCQNSILIFAIGKYTCQTKQPLSVNRSPNPGLILTILRLSHNLEDNTLKDMRLTPHRQLQRNHIPKDLSIFSEHPCVADYFSAKFGPPYQ